MVVNSPSVRAASSANQVSLETDLNTVKQIGTDTYFNFTINDPNGNTPGVQSIQPGDQLVIKDQGNAIDQGSIKLSQPNNVDYLAERYDGPTHSIILTATDLFKQSYPKGLSISIHTQVRSDIDPDQTYTFLANYDPKAGSSQTIPVTNGGLTISGLQKVSSSNPTPGTKALGVSIFGNTFSQAGYILPVSAPDPVIARENYSYNAVGTDYPDHEYKFLYSEPVFAAYAQIASSQADIPGNLDGLEIHSSMPIERNSAIAYRALAPFSGLTISYPDSNTIRIIGITPRYLRV